MPEWPAVPLTDLFEIASGLSKPRDQFGFGRSFVTFKDVLDNYFLPDQLASLVNSTAEEQEKCSVLRGDVFLTRTSETQDELGMSCVALKDYPGATFNGFTKRLRPKQSDAIVPEYAAYYFRSARFRQQVTAMSSMSTRASLNNEMISRLDIVVPPRDTQEAIGRTLRCLDERIEQNRRTVRALERLARAIYRAWFVDFEPVRAKAAGAASFPSMPQAVFDALTTTFTNSGLGPVPEGWGVTPLPTIATFLNGLALQKFPARGDGSDLAVIKIAELRKGSTESADAANCDVPAQYVVNDGDLLFSWSGTLEVQRWFGGRGALNQHLFKVTPFRHPLWFVHHVLLDHLPEFRAIASSKATTMGHIQRKHLDAALAVDPPDGVMRGADEVIRPVFQQTASLRIELRRLAALRDYLLPKLLQGDVRVLVPEDSDGW
jgi:type I restriction enzyme S subunit